MPKRVLLPLIATLAVAQTCTLAQGVIGGNQNGLGPGGYLPQPPSSTPSNLQRAQLVTALATQGYEMNIVEISGTTPRVIIDPSQPIIEPLATAPAALNPSGAPASSTTALGFRAIFSIVNNTAANRVFEFSWQYWADRKIVFRIYDANDDVVWQSVQIPVDKPPLAPPVYKTLKSHSAWRQNVFVPLNPGGIVLSPGEYRLEGSITGTPEFSADAAFEVNVTVGGPIIKPAHGS